MRRPIYPTMLKNKACSCVVIFFDGLLRRDEAHFVSVCNLYSGAFGAVNLPGQLGAE